MGDLSRGPTIILREYSHIRRTRYVCVSYVCARVYARVYTYVTCGMTGLVALNLSRKIRDYSEEIEGTKRNSACRIHSRCTHMQHFFLFTRCSPFPPVSSNCQREVRQNVAFRGSLSIDIVAVSRTFVSPHAICIVIESKRAIELD